MKSPHSGLQFSIAYYSGLVQPCSHAAIDTLLSEISDVDFLPCTSLSQLSDTVNDKKVSAICVYINEEGTLIKDILTIAASLPVIVMIDSKHEKLAIKALSEGAFEYICVDRDCSRTVFRLIYHSVQQYQVMHELRSLRTTTNEITTIKRRFLNHIGRELTGPMSAIVDLVDLTLGESNLDAIRENLKSIQDSAVALKLLARDILALTEEANIARHTYREEFDLQGEFTHALSLLSIDARHHGMKLYSDFKGHCPHKVIGDLFTFKQLIIVVISGLLRLRSMVNAINVEARCTVLSEVQQACFFSFTISFPQGKSVPDLMDTTLSDSQHPLSGTLTVAQSLAEQLNGNIRFNFLEHSLQAVSVTIPLSIPVHAVTHRARMQQTDSNVNPFLKVLVADDHEINRRVLQRWLERRKHRVFLAHDGGEAIDMCEKEQFDLILMDIQMPKVDGLQAAKWIRSERRSLNNRTPLFAVSAHLSEDSEQISHAEGIDGVFHKPLHFPLLVDLIERLQLKKYSTFDAERTKEKGSTRVIPRDREARNLF